VWATALKSHHQVMSGGPHTTSDGQFSHAPTDMWVFVNHHLALASDAQCLILHVMVIDCVVVALRRVIHDISQYVFDLSGVQTPVGEAAENEMQFMCLLANDITLHGNVSYFSLSSCVLHLYICDFF
jgi:hypothetical protein